MDTIRQKIISAIESGLASIRKSGGYQTDIGAKVEVAKSAIDQRHLPAVVLWPQSETGVKLQGRNKMTMSARIEGIVSLGANEDAVKIGEMILGDIRKRLESLTEDITGGYGDHVEYTSGGVENYPEPGETAVNCPAVYNIVYKTKTGDPFNQ